MAKKWPVLTALVFSSSKVYAANTMRLFLPERNEQTLHGFSIVSYHVTLIFQSLYDVQ